MTVLVTGGSGFLGRAVLALAAARGLEALALVRSGAAAAQVAALGATPLSGDLDHPDTVDEAFETAVGGGATALVNLASLGFGHAPTVITAAERAGLSRAVFVSTTAVVTGVATASRQVRLAAEAAIETSRLRWTIVRPTMIYGRRGDRNLSRLLTLLRRAPVVPLPGGGTRLQQPVHVDDLAQAVLAALDAPHSVGRRYDVAGPEPLTFRDLVRESAEAVGRRPLLLPVPLGPTVRLLEAYEGLVGAPRLRAEQVQRLAEDKAFDISAARRDLGFDPRPFPAGIRAEARELAC